MNPPAGERATRSTAVGGGTGFCAQAARPAASRAAARIDFVMWTSRRQRPNAPLHDRPAAIDVEIEGPAEGRGGAAARNTAVAPNRARRQRHGANPAIVQNGQ